MATRKLHAAARRAFRWEGLPELQEKLAEIVDDVSGKAMKEVLYDNAKVVAEAARRLAPVDEGNLQKGIFASQGDQSKPSALVGVDYRVAPHAHLVEFGHAGPHPAGPHPFMRPAIAQTKEQVRKGLADGLGEIIKRHTK